VNEGDFQPLIDLIKSSVGQGTWRTDDSDREGFGSITPFFPNNSLIVRHTPEVQEQVGQFLQQLRRLPAFAAAPREDVPVAEPARPTLAPSLNVPAREAPPPAPATLTPARP
jgi:hypothetical protein